MEGNIIGEPFDKFVYNEIGSRQSNQFSGTNENRTPAQIQYLNNQSSWIKLASSVSISGSDVGQSRVEELLTDKNQSLFGGSSLAEEAILFNGLSSLPKPDKEGNISYTQRSGIYKENNIWNSNYAYGLGGRDFGIQPMPGITDLQITCENRGSIRTATLNIKAYNKFQFELIELLYLRIGYTMMLEWGNNKYIDPETNEFKDVRNTVIEDIWFKENGTSQLAMLDIIKKYRITYSGNYDGFMGRVVNFNWSFSPDGSYDIRLDLITVGDIIESLQVNIPLSIVAYVDNDNDDSTPLNEIDNAIEYYLFSSKQDKEKKLSDNKEYFSIAEPVTEQEQKEKIDPKYNYYVTLGEFLKQLELLVLPNFTPQGASESFPCLSFDTNVAKNFINVNINQTPLDPRVCIFKFGFDQNDASVKGLFTPVFIDDLKDFITQEGEVTVGLLMNLYLNFDFIEKCLKQNVDNQGKLSLFGFLSNLCNGINNSLSNVCNLEPIIKDDYIITIIDQNPIQGLIEQLDNNSIEDIVPFEVYGYNLSKNTSNFVKNFELNTSITPDLAAMVSIGATAAGGNTKGIDATAFSKWNAGLVDRFKEKSSIADTKTSEEEAKKIIEREVKFGERWDGYTTPTTILNKVNIALQNLSARIYNSIKSNGENANTFEGGAQTPLTVPGSLVASSFVTSKYIGTNLPSGVKPGFYTKDEFINEAEKAYQRDKQQLKNKAKEQKEKIRGSYYTYLVDAFGGNEVSIGNGKTKTVTRDESQFLNFDDEIIARGKRSYQEYLRVINELAREKAEKEAKKIKDIYASNQIGFIPINLSLTLQGIAGIKIYNKLSINQKFLPKNYPDSLHFIITKVNHKIVDNTWETNLETISMPITRKQDLKLEAPIFSTDLDEEPLPSERGPILNNGPRFYFVQGKNLPLRAATGPATNTNLNKAGERISLTQILNEINPTVRSNFELFFNELNGSPSSGQGSGLTYRGYYGIVNSLGRSFEKSYFFKYVEYYIDENGKRQKNTNYNPSFAAPGYSPHNYYAAIDMNIVTPEGEVLKREGMRNKWLKTGIPDIAKKYGLVWGGDFNTEDSVHFAIRYKTNEAITSALSQVGITGGNVNDYLVPSPGGSPKCFVTEEQSKQIDGYKVKLTRLIDDSFGPQLQ